MNVFKGIGTVILLAAAAATWLLWDAFTPAFLDVHEGALAGFSIGQTKQEIIARGGSNLQPSGRTSRLRNPELVDELLRSEKWEAAVAVPECPKEKRCPSEAVLSFQGNKLREISVKCWLCP